MENTAYEVKGRFRIGHDWKVYTKVVQAPNEQQAKERILATIGSKHHLERRYITIESVGPAKE